MEAEGEATQKTPASVLDAVGKWPAGTTGTVVSEHGEERLVEIADQRGVALDYVSVAASRLRPRVGTRAS